MTKRISLNVVLFAVATIIAGCGAPTGATSPTAAPTNVSAATSAPAATNTLIPIIAPTAVSAPRPTGAPAATSVPQPTNAPAPTSASAPTSAPAAPVSTSAPPAGAVDVPYLDDRSSAEALITSFYNAINRKEFARAYGYWTGAAELPPYGAFEQGYSSTSAVQVGFGTITGDVGAGQSRYSVPVRITSQTIGGEQYFVGCYTLHLASPAAQATLPFQPLAIESAAVQQSETPATAGALQQACSNGGSPVPPTAETGAIDQSVYLDNLSDPVNVLRSFYNAINRHEYTRAYSYWQNQSGLAPLSAFSEGYSTTQAVALTTGDVQSDVGAGQRNYRVPVTIQSQMNDGSTQTFAGCYALHLSSPAIQTPPFKPLGITAATIQQVAAGGTPTDEMNKSCQ